MPAPRARILVVEDETFLVKIYDVKLKKEGFDVGIATDGEAALAMAVSFRPDLILLDLLLPKLDGFEVLRRLRAEPKTKHIQVIVLSNLGQEEDMKRARALGAEDYLIKADHTLQEIIAKIRQQLERRSA